MPRARFNPKRTLREPRPSARERAAIRQRISYAGSPLHKRDPGDFGLDPPASPRPHKTLCDVAGIREKRVAEGLLADGVERGLVSLQERGGLPQNIWAVTADGIPLEAQLENQEMGTYHGYPLPSADPLHAEVLRWWEAG